MFYVSLHNSILNCINKWFLKKDFYVNMDSECISLDFRRIYFNIHDLQK